MSDRALLFIGSILLIVLSLAAAAWLVISGQVFGLDGLFMLLVCLTTALVFALYAWNIVSLMLDEIAKERAPKPAPKGGTAKTTPKESPA